jgi:hypothetical protein
MPGRTLKKIRQVVMLNKPCKYTMDLTQAMEDEDQVIEMPHYISYLQTHLKPGGKKAVSEHVSVEGSGKKVIIIYLQYYYTDGTTRSLLAH